MFEYVSYNTTTEHHCNETHIQWQVNALTAGCGELVEITHKIMTQCYALLLWEFTKLLTSALCPTLPVYLLMY